MSTEDSTERKPRLLYVDILRVLACFLVILTHSAMPLKNQEHSIYLGILAFLGSPSSELFLSLSGAVLLPVKVSFRDFYKRRFLKLLPPLFFWSVTIVLVYWCLGLRTFADALQSIIFLPIKPVIGVYWFVYVMIGLYLLAPIISPWLKKASKKQIEFFFIIWGFNLLLPYLNLLIPGKFDLNGSHYWSLNYFGGFLGYWLIGYYLRIYPIKIGLNPRFIFISCGVLFYLCLILTAKLFTDWNMLTLYDNLQVGSAFMVAMLYTLAQHIKISKTWLINSISDIAKLSFGIYLIHIVIVKQVVWKIFENINLHPIPQTLLISILSIAICYFVVKAISKIPGSKYIIGV